MSELSGVTVEKNAINLRKKLENISEHWSPKVIAGLNDYQFKLAKVQGEFVWHNHPETDEAFLILKGSLDIVFRDGLISLKEGELYVVPRGIEHKPIARSECHILLIEPAGTINTGTASGELTAPSDVWI